MSASMPTTSWPCWANSRTHAAPTRLAEPVTTTTLIARAVEHTRARSCARERTSRVEHDRYALAVAHEAQRDQRASGARPGHAKPVVELVGRAVRAAHQMATVVREEGAA